MSIVMYVIIRILAFTIGYTIGCLISFFLFEKIIITKERKQAEENFEFTMKVLKREIDKRRKNHEEKHFN